MVSEGGSPTVLLRVLPAKGLRPKSLVPVAVVGRSRRHPVLAPSLVSCHVSVVVVRPRRRLLLLLATPEGALLCGRLELSGANVVFVMHTGMCIYCSTVLFAPLVVVNMMCLGAGRRNLEEEEG